MPVVVAARGKSSISKDDELTVVAYGGGEISIPSGKRQTGRDCLKPHYFGGEAAQKQASIHDGRLTITEVADHSATGKPLEWIDIHIS